MRIRKRPPSSSSLPLSPDPSLQAHPPNGKDTSGGGARQELHPVGDLPIDPHHLGENPNTRLILDPPLSDPYPDAIGNGSRPSSPLLPTREPVQALKEEEKGRTTTTVDSNKIGWNGQANSSNRISGSSGAVASGAAQVGEMISLQKRTRGRNDDGNGDGTSETTLMEQEKKAKAKARACTGPALANNNCTSDKEGCDGGAAAVRSRIGSNFVNAKRRRSPAVLMEGSRCSRVNGRGWRCCQQTLVGYSLCEHHLGKGRLRSMSSVRGQLGTSKPKWSTDARNGVVPSTYSVPQKQVAIKQEEQKQSPQPHAGANYGADNIEEEEEEEDEKIARNRKKKKIGLVKARSISSLLDDTNHPVPSSLLSQSPEVALMSPTHDNKAK